MALVDLIKLNKHRPDRRLYIKRRLTTDGSYESDWLRIDNYLNKQRVIDWGSVSQTVDEQPGLIAAFTVSGLSLSLDNYDGLFNIETKESSLWLSLIHI